MTMRSGFMQAMLAMTTTARVACVACVACAACGGSEPAVKEPPPSMDTPHNTTGQDRTPGGPGAIVTSTAPVTPAAPTVTATATATTGAAAPSTTSAMTGKPASTGSSTTSSMSPPGGSGGPCDKCVGTVSDDLQKALNKRAQQSRSCYVKVLTNNPTANAAMNIELKVGRDGSACESQALSEEPKWPGLADCVLADFKKGGFPTPGGASCVVARVPISYTPAK